MTNTLRARWRSMLSLLLLLNVCLVTPYPSGAPDFVCDSMVPSHYGSGPSSDPAPFHVELSQDTYRPNEIITVTLKSNSTRQFIGFLSEMRQYNTNTLQPILVGSFDRQEFVARPLCTGNGGLTHQTNTPRFSLMTTWRAPPAQQGSLQVRVTFVETFSTYWTGVTSAVLRPATETTTTVTTTTTTTTTPTTTTMTTTSTTTTTTTTPTTTTPTTTTTTTPSTTTPPTTTTSTTTPTTTTTTTPSTTTSPTTTTTTTTTPTTTTENPTTTITTPVITTTTPTATTTSTTTSVTTPSVTEQVTSTPSHTTTSSSTVVPSHTSGFTHQNTKPASETPDDTVVQTMGQETTTSEVTVEDGNIGSRLLPTTLFVGGLVCLTAVLGS